MILTNDFTQVIVGGNVFIKCYEKYVNSCFPKIVDTLQCDILNLTPTNDVFQGIWISIEFKVPDIFSVVMVI